MKTSFTWITKINPVSWRELLIFCRPKLQRFCLSIRKSVRLPLRKYHVPTNWQPCVRCGGTFLRCFSLCYPNRFICICIYLKPNKCVGGKARLNFCKGTSYALERKATLSYILSSLLMERLRTSAQARISDSSFARSYEEPRPALGYVVFISARAVQSRKAADNSQLFCKVNSLNIA